MHRFQNILVGVDLAAADRLVSREIVAPTRAAVDRAIWLASRTGARLKFLHALDVSHATERLIAEHRGESQNVFDAANELLADFISQASEQGVEATSQIAIGRSWYKLITEVLEDEHDLVVVGTRNPGRMERVLFGSTAMKLLRKCPCPVWVTKPGGAFAASIVVAHDLSEVGSRALELGSAMAQLNDSEFRVLHAIEHPEYNDLFPGMVTVAESSARLERALGQITAELAAVGRDPSAIELSDDPPDAAIRHWLERHPVDLLVMGTVARSGVPGFFVGNTAERLLPTLNCSVLAVKPEGFVCPVSASATAGVVAAATSS